MHTCESAGGTKVVSRWEWCELIMIIAVELRRERRVRGRREKMGRRIVVVKSESTMGSERNGKTGELIGLSKRDEHNIIDSELKSYQNLQNSTTPCNLQRSIPKMWGCGKAALTKPAPPITESKLTFWLQKQTRGLVTFTGLVSANNTNTITLVTAQRMRRTDNKTKTCVPIGCLGRLMSCL